MRSLVFFNNKGGVGKTTLTFNLAHMLARQGQRVALVDFDPQCNLTAIVLSEEELLDRWERSENPGRTVASCVDKVRRGIGDVEDPEVVSVADNLWLVAGDLALSRFEQPLAEGWAQVHGSDNERAIHVTTALERLANRAATLVQADLVLVDVGPSLGALNRAALLACDAVLVPLAPDLFSLQGLRNVGPTLRQWRDDWEKVHAVGQTRALRSHRWFPIGYVVQQHLARVDRPVQGYERWARRIPGAFRKDVLGVVDEDAPQDFGNDEYCIALLKHFASLVPIAQERRKPIFDLKRADGIGGGHIQAVARARKEFEELARLVLERLVAIGPHEVRGGSPA